MIHTIPSYTTIDESYLLLIESAENDFNVMMANIAIDECYSINGNGALLESGDSKVKGIINSIVNWIKARWADLQNVFNKAMDAIHKKVDEFNSKVAKSTLKWIPKKLDKLKDKSYGKTYEYPNFDSLSSDGGSVFAAVRVYSDNVLKTLSSSEGSNENIKKELERIDSSFRREFGIGTDSKDSAIKGSMEKIIKGAEVDINRDYIKKNYESMVNNCGDYSKTQRTLKSTLNTAKKEFDKQIKEIKKKEKENEDFTSKLGVIAPYIKKSHHYLASASSIILSCTRNKMMKEMSIILRLAMTFGKNQAQNESYVEESQSYQSEMSSLFNFNI